MTVPMCAHEQDIWGGISALLHKHRQVAGLYGIQEANLSLLEISTAQDCLMPYLCGDDSNISDITTNPGTQCHMRFLIKRFNTMSGRLTISHVEGLKDLYFMCKSIQFINHNICWTKQGCSVFLLLVSIHGFHCDNMPHWYSVE